MGAIEGRERERERDGRLRGRKSNASEKRGKKEASEREGEFFPSFFSLFSTSSSSACLFFGEREQNRGKGETTACARSSKPRNSTLDTRHSTLTCQNKTKKKKLLLSKKKKLKNHHSVGRPQQAGHQGRRQRRARDPDREARRQLRDEGVRPGQGRRLQPRPRVWPRRGDELYAADLPGELRRAHLQGARLHHRRRGLARRPSAVRADQHVAVAARRGRVRDVRRVGRVPRVAVGESRFFLVFVSVESDSNSASSPPPASPSLSCARARVSSQ